MMNDKRTTMDKLKFVEKNLRDIKRSNNSSDNLNLGIFYGLIFGIIGNLYITLLFDYKLKFLSNNLEFGIIGILTIIILFLLFIFSSEFKKSKINNKKLESAINKILHLQDKHEKGESIRKEFSEVMRRD